MNYKKLTDEEKNSLVTQYQPLINKLVNQFFSKVQCSWEDLQSYAYEGFALAICKYDEQKSSMSFTQYAAFSIRNNILNCLNDELRTVKLNPYAQKAVLKNGGSLFNTISIDHSSDDEDENNCRKIVLSAVVDETFSNGDVFEYLYSRLEDEFPYRDCEMFYRTFGLKDFDVEKGMDIAKRYDISAGLVSQKIKKIILWIRKDPELCEQLSELIK